MWRLGQAPQMTEEANSQLAELAAEIIKPIDVAEVRSHGSPAKSQHGGHGPGEATFDTALGLDDQRTLVVDSVTNTADLVGSDLDS